MKISGFSEAELLGESHNIVRHPEKMRAALKTLHAPPEAAPVSVDKDNQKKCVLLCEYASQNFRIYIVCGTFLCRIGRSLGAECRSRPVAKDA